MRDRTSRWIMLALILALPALMAAAGGWASADWATVVGVQVVLGAGLMYARLMKRWLRAPVTVTLPTTAPAPLASARVGTLVS